MNDLEKQLRDAMRPVPPPHGFSERLFRRIERERGRPATRPAPLAARWWRRPAMQWSMVACLGGLVAGSVLFARLEVQRRQGLEAKRATLLALRITGVKLRSVQGLTQDLYYSGRPTRSTREEP